ncbi:cystathionine gamma-lyase [Trichonephila clavipes]|nr:cystathionine gamma-lyase [Trichonephila clavipes]
MEFEFETRAVHCGEDPSKSRLEKKSIVFDSLDDELRVIDGNSKQKLEKSIASLEHAKYGLCYPSGTAAVTSISMMVEDGEHVVIFDSVYHDVFPFSAPIGLGSFELLSLKRSHPFRHIPAQAPRAPMSGYTLCVSRRAAVTGSGANKTHC